MGKMLLAIMLNRIKQVQGASTERSVYPWSSAKVHKAFSRRMRLFHPQMTENHIQNSLSKEGNSLTQIIEKSRSRSSDSTHDKRYVICLSSFPPLFPLCLPTPYSQRCSSQEGSSQAPLQLQPNRRDSLSSELQEVPRSSLTGPGTSCTHPWAQVCNKYSPLRPGVTIQGKHGLDSQEKERIKINVSHLCTSSLRSLNAFLQS